MQRNLLSGNKIHFTSLGCARNLVDTEVMLGLVLKAGYEITQQEEEADFLVINTCGFLESARQEGIDTIRQLFSIKKETAKVIVAGCMVPKQGDFLKTTFPKIHYLLGPGDVEKILEALTQEEQKEENRTPQSYLQWGEIPRQVSTPGHYAYLKIAEGCKKQCSFCIIPKIKGPLKSKSQEQVLKEFKSLLQQGVYEVILIAQDLGDYGKERKEDKALEILLQSMLEIPGNYWIRLLYLYPDEISDDLIELMQKDSRLLPYLDMPIQHINSAILKKMRRKTDRNQIISTYKKLHDALPDLVLRTSLMVGFPGETEDQFKELISFVKDYPFDNIGVFPYSLEKEAYAATLPNQISEDIKQNRFHTLMETQKKVSKKLNQKYLGKKLEVIVEKQHPESKFLLQGRFYGQCPEIDGTVILSDARAVKTLGQFYTVLITDAFEYDLVGKALPPVKKNIPSLSIVSS